MLDLARSLPRVHLESEQTTTRVSTPAFVMVVNDAPRVEALLLGAAISLGLILGTTFISHMRAPTPNVALPSDRGLQIAAPVLPRATTTDRHRLIQAVAAEVRRHYFDPQLAETTAADLFAHDRAGDYNAILDDQAFASLVARNLIEASRDNHFTVEYTSGAFPDFSKPPPGEFHEHYRAAMKQADCTFEKVEMRRNNVGYLKLNSFPDISVCQSRAESAMAALNNANAIIFDLRDNRGGYANMVVLLASYLFDHPEYMFNPRDPVSEQTWTRSPIRGSKLADKPVYILTSSRTYSAAEQFSFDLKMLKRATLIGERTAGASHSGVLFNIGEHFAVGIPEHRPLNPFSDKDWALIGVEPDVQSNAASALATAVKLAQKSAAKQIDDRT